MMSSCGSVAVCLRFFAVAELVSVVSKVSEPTQKKDSDEAQHPVFSYIINNICHGLGLWIR